jgi:hypothetical protein
MRVLGVGLSRTGTTSLHQALQLLGLKSIHYDKVRLNDVLDGTNAHPDFRRYDDVDAVLDIPSAAFFEELLAAYPACKAILTIRDIESWWQSMVAHYGRRPPVETATRWQRLRARFDADLRDQLEVNRFKTLLRNHVYGSVTAQEFMYKKKYVMHNERVIAKVPADRLLVMNICDGQGWEALCPFLGLPHPGVPFPHVNAVATVTDGAGV